jgi:hypothetical protein
MAKEVGHLLGEISEDKCRSGRPMLSALAVHEQDGEPGNGFFELAKLIGKLNDDSEESRDRFWAQERDAAYILWRKKPKL